MADVHPTPRIIVSMPAIEPTAPSDSTAPSPPALKPLPPRRVYGRRCAHLWQTRADRDAGGSGRFRTAAANRLGATDLVLGAAPEGSGRLRPTASQRAERSE